MLENTQKQKDAYALIFFLFYTFSSILLALEIIYRISLLGVTLEFLPSIINNVIDM